MDGPLFANADVLGAAFEQEQSEVPSRGTAVRVLQEGSAQSTAVVKLTVGL